MTHSAAQRANALIPAVIAGAAVCLALALAISYGTLEPYALALITLAGAAALAASRLSLPQAPNSGTRPVVVVLGVGLAASLVHNLLYLPGVLVDPGRLGGFRPGMAAVAVVLLSYFWRGVPVWVARVRFPLVVLLAMVLGAAVLRASSAPGIDVWIQQQRGALALLSGYNPYASLYPNIYGPGTPLIDPSLLTPDGRYVLTNPYMPLTLLFDVPSAALGDVRWTMLAAVVAAAFLIRELGRRSQVAELAAVFLLMQPQAFFVLEMAWTDPLALATTLLAVLAVSRVRREAWTAGNAPRAAWLLPGLAGAVAAATKQYVPLLLVPLLFALPVRARLRAGAVALAGACATLVPFLVWDPAALFRGIIEFQIRQPFRADALSWPAAIAAWGGVQLPVWPAFLLAGASFLATLRRQVTAGQALLSGVVAWLIFVILNKQAFCNYYWLAVGLLCAAAALFTTPLRDAELVADGGPPG